MEEASQMAIKIAVFAVIVLLLQDWVNQTVSSATWNAGPKMGGNIKTGCLG
jgi:hypothetical protein